MPLVSVIIPVYNVLPYLREAIESVVNQTYSNIEILIIDDGSTDGSGEICDEYLSDPRVVVIHQENKGLSGARNKGLDRITGDYVTFLDPDDAYHPEMIQLLLDAITRYNADIVACAYGVYETEDLLNNTKQIRKVRATNERTLTGREATTAQIEGLFDEATWNKLYKKLLWKKVRFPEGHVYEDIRVMPLVYEECSCIVEIPQELVYHRERAGSITKTRTIDNCRELLDAYGVLRNYVEKAQPPFPSKSTQAMREVMSRVLVLRWAEFREQNVSSDLVDKLKIEIIDFVGGMDNFQQTKSRVAWWLFRYCPGLLQPVRKFSKHIKQILQIL